MVGGFSLINDFEIDLPLIEEKLSRTIQSLEQEHKSRPKDFSFYWSKKSHLVAASICKLFASDEDIIFDPFMGSGSALYGMTLFTNKMKFLGVDVNRLPIEFVHFNLQSLSKKEIDSVASKVSSIIRKNRDVYDYSLDSNEAPYVFSKVHFDIQEGSIYPTLFVFKRENKKITLTAENGPIFQKASQIYQEKFSQYKKMNQGLPDLELSVNSRIAIKKGMYLSDIFSPISFNLLLNFRELAKSDITFAIILSTCLHLCRLTDTRSQSQFPYWVPKKGIVDRNILDLLDDKFNQFIDLQKQRSRSTRTHTFPERMESFEQILTNEKACYLLLNQPIQALTESQVPDSSVDLVFTDPPYFDQVAYSEYLVIWEFFTGMKSDLANEIIESNRDTFSSSRQNYLKLLKEGFEVIGRKLKDNHLAIVYFKDSKLRNIADFLQVMESAGFEYLNQIHVPKSKFTYKQNTSQKGTVEGDSLYIFRKGYKKVREASKSSGTSNVDYLILELVEEYLRTEGVATPSKILDNWVIPSLFRLGKLHLVTSDNAYQKLINAHFIVDRETREIIGRK